jgi:glycerol-3-phosphate dehydrogenase
VALNAIAAGERGARILPRTECVSARRAGASWQAVLRDSATGATRPVTARAMVNAAGPWVDRFLTSAVGANSSKRVRLVKGSHIVVPRIYDGDQAYLIQHTDRRVIFINPYEQDYLLIGTTDIPYEGTPDDVASEPSEVEYLCAAVNRYFRRQIAPADVVHEFSGVRPLLDDQQANPSAVTRDYSFELAGGPGEAPLLSIFGGKITTYRRLAEQALDRLRPFFPGMKGPWTATTPLPGGDMAGSDFAAFERDLSRRHAWLPPEVAHHYGRCYGTRAERLLDGATTIEDLGRHFGAGLYEREVAYLRREEWAESAADILWRRTKVGLHLSAEQVSALAEFLSPRGPAAETLRARR